MTRTAFQSSQATFHEQHLENALDFGEDFIIDDTDDVDEDINGIQHLFDEWNESKSFHSINKLKLISLKLF